MTIVANGQVQVAVTIIIAPSHTPGSSRERPKFDERPSVLPVITINLVDLVYIPNSQIKIIVTVIITPGHAIGCLDVGADRIKGYENIPPLITIYLIGLILIANGQVEIAISVIITPGHASGIFRAVVQIEWGERNPASISENHIDMRVKSTKFSSVVCFYTISITVISKGKIKITVTIIITPGHAISDFAVGTKIKSVKVGGSVISIDLTDLISKLAK